MLIKELIKESFISRTGFGTEAEGFVRVVVLGRGAPAVAIVPASCGTAVILLSLKGEWEFTCSPLGVTPQGEEHCKKKRSTNTDIIYRILHLFSLLYIGVALQQS